MPDVRKATAEHVLSTIAEMWRVYLEKRHGIMLGLLPEDAGMMSAMMNQCLYMTTGEGAYLQGVALFTDLVRKMELDQKAMAGGSEVAVQ